MRPFQTITAIAAPLPVAHIDTDQILPARFMKTLTRKGLGRRLFNDWRYDDDGREVEDFILNQDVRREAQIIIAYENFGCGSSREHAVWALDDFGIGCIIAPSFGSIFATNCVKNGLLPVQLSSDSCDELIEVATSFPEAALSIDLECQCVTGPEGQIYPFEIREDIRYALLAGLDDISRTLTHSDALGAFEATRSES
ncbi:3-isopropylmalate dehydratase small subunit [Hyphomonas sp.]|jgi:3-isopropylmalate/(R)-2-methylmalate dehydratase small subunit|uniref:3-isopropylmalate dehydratase small subunit n=1 Tax=Hyphomonas sp. TaxID=87 RepID=UPI0032D97E81